MSVSLEDQIIEKKQNIKNLKEKIQSVSKRIIPEIEKTLPECLREQIQNIVTINSEKVISMSPESINNLQTEIDKIINQKLREIIEQLNDNPAWFECQEHEIWREYTIAMIQELRDVIEIINKPLTDILEQSGLDVRRVYSKNSVYISPFQCFDNSDFKKMEKEYSVLKQKYCKEIQEVDRIQKEKLRQDALEKWKKIRK